MGWWGASCYTGQRDPRIKHSTPPMSGWDGGGGCDGGVASAATADVDKRARSLSLSLSLSVSLSLSLSRCLSLSLSLF